MKLFQILHTDLSTSSDHIVLMKNGAIFEEAITVIFGAVFAAGRVKATPGMLSARPCNLSHVGACEIE
jgi:hypothetical protein